MLEESPICGGFYVYVVDFNESEESSANYLINFNSIL